MVTHVHRGPNEGGYAEVSEMAAGEALTALRVPGLTLRLDAL